MFDIGERVICVDDTGAEGRIVRGRSYIVRAQIPAKTVWARHLSGAYSTVEEDCIGIGISSCKDAFRCPGWTVLISDVWPARAFRRPHRLETRTALTELVGLVDSTRETVEA